MVQPNIVIVELIERNMNDHIWELAHLLGIVEANTWEIAPLGMLLILAMYSSNCILALVWLRKEYD